MDDAERVPIDIGYEVASEAEPSDPRMTVREDGTIVIDLLAPQPCEADPTTGDEIVVCAQVEGEQDRRPSAARYRPGPPPLEKLHEALTEQVGPLLITPFGVKLKF